MSANRDLFQPDLLLLLLHLLLDGDREIDEFVRLDSHPKAYYNRLEEYMRLRRARSYAALVEAAQIEALAWSNCGKCQPRSLRPDRSLFSTSTHAPSTSPCVLDRNIRSVGYGGR